MKDGDLELLLSVICGAGIEVQSDRRRKEEFLNLVKMYDPYLNALSKRLLMPLPEWIIREEREDNWKITAWGRSPSAIP